MLVDGLATHVGRMEAYALFFLGCGAIGVLHKPFAADELLSRLQQLKPRGLIVVADDDPGASQSIVGILSAAGYGAEIARTGGEVATKLRSAILWKRPWPIGRSAAASKGALS